MLFSIISSLHLGALIIVFRIFTCKQIYYLNLVIKIEVSHFIDELQLSLYELHPLFFLRLLGGVSIQ